jgi:uncharacterized protein (TIGR03437 family)
MHQPLRLLIGKTATGFLLTATAILVTTGQIMAQGGNTVHISASSPLARIRVDGREIQGAASFNWPAGTTHYIEFPTADDGWQYDALHQSRLRFQRWTINGTAWATAALTSVVVTAGPELKTIFAELEVPWHRVIVNWFHDKSPPNIDSDSPPYCGGPGAPPPDEFRTGVVYIDNACYWNTVILWLREGVHTIEAHPYPGFVFLGWVANPMPPTGFVRTLTVTFPMVITPRFAPGKRVRFRTDPPGLRVLVDRTEVLTTDVEPCVSNTWVAPFPPRSIEPLCTGEFDFVMDSKHIFGAPSPQTDRWGKTWVFDSFSNGMEANSIYTVTSLMPSETIVARFRPGVPVSFNTEPRGLTLAINGRDNWGSNYFVFAGGSTHTVSAPIEQYGPNGRKFAFKRWSNNGEATQEITVPLEAGREGVHLVAEYEMLSRVSIQVNPVGAEILVDGEPCRLPCNVDRRGGEQVTLEAPSSHTLGPTQRLDFLSWSDGAPRVREVAAPEGGDPLSLRADFQRSFQLQFHFHPAGGASVHVAPPSPDDYYAEGASLQLSVQERPGYRFRRYDGDLSTTSRIATLTMARPRSVSVMLDRVPFVAPAGVRNAAGETPVEGVAPGSLVSIFGGDLAPGLAVADSNPLPQALAGVSVLVGDRILPLLFVSSEQINAQLPWDLAPGEHEVRVVRSGQGPITGKFQVAPSAPGVFHYRLDEQDWGLAMHEDGTLVTRESPARKGELISLYATGFGGYGNPPPFGFLLPPSPNFRALHQVAVANGEFVIEPEFAGGAAGMAGTDIVRFRIPEEMPAAASVHLCIRVGDRDSNEILLPVE